MTAPGPISAPTSLDGLPLGFGAPCNPLLPFVLGIVALYAVPPFLGGMLDGAKGELSDHQARERRRRR